MHTQVPPEDFYRIRTAWAKTPAGRGGIAALAGFDFQLALALYELVRQYPNNLDRIRADESDIFVEALSDIVTRDQGKIVITQAKRTLASGALSKALDELWAIDCLARRIAPSSAQKFVYRVAAASSQLRDWQRSRDRWSPDDAETEALDAFKKKVSCEQIIDPRLEAARLLLLNFNDPTPLDTVDKFIGKLVDASNTSSFDSAIQKIHILLDALRQSAIDRKQSFRLWGNSDHPPAEIVRDDNEHTAIRVGERLSILDLREGRLAKRELYNGIHDACEDWLSKADGAASKLPVFWIEGRSGTGKSAALLHLLSNLYANDNSRAIVWLGDRSELIGDVIHWSAPFVRETRRVIIGIDDPYTAEHQVFESAIRHARDEWDQLRTGEIEAGRPPPFSPIIVCCGPTEQRQDVDYVCGSDIEIEPHELPKETKDDLDSLAIWYEKRTGRKAPELSGDILLVQRFFEWDKGEIGDFARRFRRRLEQFDDHRSEKIVFQTVAKILAFGRLYAEYPADPVSKARDGDPVLERAFFQLAREESHFSFSGDTNAHTGIRLTHPHLANAIYRAWFGLASDRGYRKLHLRDGIRAALGRYTLPASQRFGPLWAIAKIASGRSPVAERSTSDLRERITLIREELATILPELFDELVAQSSSPLTDFPVWTDLAVSFNLKLLPNPFSVLSAALGEAVLPASGLRLACHKLLQHRDHVPQHLDSIELIAALLERLSSWRDSDGRPWRDWAPLALDFIQKVGVTRIALAVNRVMCLYPTWPAIGKLATELTSTIDKQPISRSILLNWLDHAPSWLPSWPGVLGDVYEKTGRCDRFDLLAIQFLSENPEHGSWSFFWQYLWNDGVLDRQLLEQRALAWLGIYTLQNVAFPATSNVSVGGFDRVWQDLWRYYRTINVNSDALVLRGTHWLSIIDSNHGGWQFVWDELWQDAKDDSDRRAVLRGLADKWLDAVDLIHGSWSYIWEELWQDAKDDSDRRAVLRGLADKWLDAVDLTHGSWSYIWRELWQDAKDDSDRRAVLRGLADKWLAAVDPTHGSWAYIWEELWQDANDDSDRRAVLRGLADKWLAAVDPTHGSWAYIWEELWQDAKDDSDRQMLLRGLADKWLDAVDPIHGSWAYIWEELWQDAKDDNDRRAVLRSLAKAWLDAINPEHDSWAFVWSDLWEAEAASPERRSELAIQAQHWIARVGKSSRSFLVEQTLLGQLSLASWQWSDNWKKEWRNAAGNAGARDDLASQAKWWLRRLDLKQGGWTSVWKELWEDAINEPEARQDLKSIGGKWLGAVAPTHPRWSPVWLIIWYDTINNGQRLDQLALLARAWLTGEGKRVEWENVWQSLWSLPHFQDEELRTVAQRLVQSDSSLASRLIEDHIRDSDNKPLR